MVPRLPLQLLLRNPLPACSAAAAFLSPRIPLCPRAFPAVGRRSGGFRTAMAAPERSPPGVEPQRLGAELQSVGAEAESGQGPPLPTTCQLLQQTATNFLKTNIKKKRKGTTGKESGNDNLIKKKKKKQDNPNYFISVPVTNPKITGGIQALQDAIIQKDNRLSKAMVHYGSLHITLLVMHLSNEAAIENAVGAFLESKGLIEELLQGKSLDLSFQGTDHFRNQVGYVKLTESDHTATLLEIAEIVKKIFQEKGIFPGDETAFKPHLTFMKLSKSPILRKQGVKRIDPTLFENFKNHYFGAEPMKRLDLCSMLKKKQPSGYYHCESSITVGKSHEADVIKEALHRELLTLLSKVSQIKALLSSPEVRMKMYKELLEKGLVSDSIRENVTDPASPVS